MAKANYKSRINAALGVALRRQYETPLDVSSVFLSLADLEAYVKRDTKYESQTSGLDANDKQFLKDINPYSYPGQIVAVFNETDNTAKAYIITSVGKNGTYQELATDSNIPKDVVKLTGNQTINGNKTFTNQVVAPSFKGDFLSNYNTTEVASNWTDLLPKETGALSLASRVINITPGLFEHNSNANSVLTINRHPGNYFSQLGFSDNGNIYYRHFNGENNFTTKPWNALLTQNSLQEKLNNSGYITNDTIDASSYYRSYYANPISKYLWHDLLSFGANGIPTLEEKIGSVWTALNYPDKDHPDNAKTTRINNLNRGLFCNKESQSITIINDETESKKVSGIRWTWSAGSSFHVANWAWLVIGVSYSSPAANAKYTLECYKNNKWVVIGQMTTKTSQTPIWLKIANESPSSLKLRLTVENAGTTGYTRLATIKLLSYRWGDQGKGSEYEYPYKWDMFGNITPLVNGDSSLGYTNSRWNNIFSKNIDLSNDIRAGGNATISGNITIGGNLIVNGTTTTLNTSNLAVKDKIIEIAKGASGIDYSGIVVPKYSSAKAESVGLLFNSTGDAFIGKTTNYESDKTTITESNTSLDKILTSNNFSVSTTSAEDYNIITNITKSDSGGISFEKDKLDIILNGNHTLTPNFAAPENKGEVKTVFRASAAATNDPFFAPSTSVYYPLCKLPIISDDNNYASAHITGRIGGWESYRVCHIDATITNRAAPSVASLLICNNTNAATLQNSAIGDIFTLTDIVCYTNDDSTVTVYLKAYSWFIFDLNIELYQKDAELLFNGTYLSEIPGTESASLSTSQNLLMLANGKAQVKVDNEWKSLVDEKLLNDKVKGFLPFDDTYIDDLNTWQTNGYKKVSSSSTHHPIECRSTDKWGILFFIAENAKNGTGSQIYYPIDGPNVGRMYVRSILVHVPVVVEGKTDENGWYKVIYSTDELEAASTKGTLTFTGATTGTFNGSENKTINIPTIAGPAGNDGYTFTPSLNDNGDLSWTKAQGAGDSAPATKNIKGPRGEKGETGSIAQLIESGGPGNNKYISDLSLDSSTKNLTATYSTLPAIPTNHVTTDTLQEISGEKTFTKVSHYQAGINISEGTKSGSGTMEFDSESRCFKFIFN